MSRIDSIDNRVILKAANNLLVGYVTSIIN